jgi:hypothetical protein
MRHAMVGRWDRLCQTAGMVDLPLTLSGAVINYPEGGNIWSATLTLNPLPLNHSEDPPDTSTSTSTPADILFPQSPVRIRS